jgi:hypothetical protein
MTSDREKTFRKSPNAPALFHIFCLAKECSPADRAEGRVAFVAAVSEPSFVDYPVQSFSPRPLAQPRIWG